MTTRFLLTAKADMALGRMLAEALGVEFFSRGFRMLPERAADELGTADRVVLLLSDAGADDELLLAIVHGLVSRRQAGELALTRDSAREVFGVLPGGWRELNDQAAREVIARFHQAARHEAEDYARATPAEPGETDGVLAPTIVAAQARGYARLAEKSPDEARRALASLRARWAQMVSLRGVVVGYAADRMLAQFWRPADALRAALRMQAEDFNSRGLKAGIGIDLGDAEEGSIRGASAAAAAVAERLASVAAHGEVLVSDLVHEVLRGAQGATFEQVSTQQVRGKSAPLMIYRASLRQTPAPPVVSSHGIQSAQARIEAAEEEALDIPSFLRGEDEQAPATAPYEAKHPAPQAPVAPADATAFTPKKLRRASPELVRISIHQPKQLRAAIHAARRADARASMAVGARLGDIAIGASVGVALDVRGALCDGQMQRRNWTGEPIDFVFVVEADATAKQAVILARIFLNDAEIGTIGFRRPITGRAAVPAAVGGSERLKRHKRVFLSYASADREIVSTIATAYRMAGVVHFFDRISLRSGEEWSPRLLREIDRSDLFHLCWSRSAAASKWVYKEAAHALGRRRQSSGKRPAITVQMLDGPPWAPHPPDLDSINFDDFVRAAIIGYARGEA